MHEATRRTADHLNPALVGLLGTLGFGRVFVSAEGDRLVDAEGRSYLDLLAGFGAVPLGHNPPRLVEGLRTAATEGLPHLVHTGPPVRAASLAEALASRVPQLPVAMLSLSGSEAVESALKLARAATGRPGLLACELGFHGLGWGALSVLGVRRFREPLEPLLPGARFVPFGDADAVERALRDRDVAAFVVEPIQAEGGVRIPPPGYLARVAELCRRAGTLLVVDEVQTGLGRCGAFSVALADGVVPDVLVLGKALGGGLLPVSAALTTRALHERAFSGERFDLHGSTYGTYALGASVALEVLAAVDELGLAQRSTALGERLVLALRERLAGHPFVREVRGRGLLVGIELGATGARLVDRLAPGLVDTVAERAFGQWVAAELLEAGILVQPASQRWNVVRLEPPLTVDEGALLAAVDTIGEVLDRYRDLRTLLAALTARLGAQWWNGGEFR
ncbi:MAG: aspartate aminotransferase family protein [Alphaproteobacteria bacterium]|nr:aspartate aminotransferase family protein [Alphaproteobacteria bacterium]